MDFLEWVKAVVVIIIAAAVIVSALAVRMEARRISQEPDDREDPTQMNYALVVSQAKRDCEAAGLDLSGACGAIRISNLTAWRLGYKLLSKSGGNRACLRPDMSCVTSGEPGFADGYIIHVPTGYGVDILGDAGGANTPAWQVETTEVERNLRAWKEPLFDPAVMQGEPPEPPDPPSGDHEERIANLEREMILTQQSLVKVEARLTVVEAEAVEDRERMEAINNRLNAVDLATVRKPLPDYVGQSKVFGGLVVSKPKA